MAEGQYSNFLISVCKELVIDDFTVIHGETVVTAASLAVIQQKHVGLACMVTLE
jgi:hypothetical protein